MHTLVIVFYWLMRRLRADEPVARAERRAIRKGLRRVAESARCPVRPRMNVRLELELTVGPPGRCPLAPAAVYGRGGRAGHGLRQWRPPMQDLLRLLLP
jgi:hypothetical protein